MLKELRACRADGTHERRLARYAGVDLLIIDDLRLRALTGEEPIELYDIIPPPAVQASTMITSNRASRSGRRFSISRFRLAQVDGSR
jgi:DNA replication protein DnaC